MPAKVTVTFTVDHPQLPGMPFVVDWPRALGLLDADNVAAYGITTIEVDVENLEAPGDPPT